MVMPSKKVPVSELSEQQSILEKEIIRIVEKALNERLVDLAIEDIKLIAREVLPDLDELISKKIKQHMVELGQFMVEKYGDDMGE